MKKLMLPRRRVLGGLAAGAGGLMLCGCDALNESPGFNRFLDGVENLNRGTHRALMNRMTLAREFDPSAMSPRFRTNGNTMPASSEYQRHLETGFANWQLQVRGLVERPLAISLERLKSLPQRTQITRHDCVEGWSAIGQWTGPQLGRILDAARLRDQAKYIVFRCADTFGSTPYYESIDLVDAYHPQTIMAWRMNGEPLPTGHGAPVRLRVERQLGYKHAKFVMAIEAVAALDAIGEGKGGFWEDRSDYEWYAGI